MFADIDPRQSVPICVIRGFSEAVDSLCTPPTRPTGVMITLARPIVCGLIRYLKPMKFQAVGILWCWLFLFQCFLQPGFSQENQLRKKYDDQLRKLQEHQAKPAFDPDRETEERLPQGRVIPDYDRSLKRVILNQFSEIAFWEDAWIEQLPEDTQIFLILPEIKEGLAPFHRPLLTENAPFTLERVYPAVLEDQVFDLQDESVDTGSWIYYRFWPQDRFETVSTTNGPLVLIPGNFKIAEFSKLHESLVKALNLAGIPARRASFAFEGGDLIFGQLGGKDFVFVGQTVFQMTQGTEEEISEQLKRTFVAAEAIRLVSGEEEGLTPFPHLDQMILPVASGKVVMPSFDHFTAEWFEEEEKQLKAEFPSVIRPRKVLGGVYSGDPVLFNALEFFHAVKGNYERALTDARRKLKELGFQVIPFPMHPFQLGLYQSYMNSILYRRGEERFALVPQFPRLSRWYDAGAEDTNKRFVELMESLGFQVKILFDQRQSKAMAGPHCSLFVIN